MRPFTRHRAWAAVFIPWLLLAAGCTITASDVEPALPDGQVEGSSTLASYANGRPVVANNSSSLISILVAAFGDSRAVAGRLRGTQLDVRAVDDQSAAYAGGKYHALHLLINAFQGPSTYPMDGQLTYYQEITPHASGQYVPQGPTFYPVPAAPAEVIITSWDAATRHVRGTFVLTVATAPGAPAVVLTAGRFDLVLD